MINYYPDFEEGQFYHVYNRGNNKQIVFFNADNYYFFLKKFAYYFSDYFNFYSYCLLPNHFHFLIQVKQFENNISIDVKKEKTLSNQISELFRRFFICITKAINMEQNRTGSLFQKNFKRLKINDPDYFTYIINYIHRNPVSHQLTNDYTNYPFSSYKSILSDMKTNLQREAVINWFGTKEEFIRYHNTNPVKKELEKYCID